MQTLHKDFWLNLIIDKFTGSISDEANLQLQNWLDASEENKQYFDRINQLWNSLDLVHEEKKYDADRAFQLFKDRVRSDKESIDKNTGKQKLIDPRRTLRYAAIFIPFLFLCYFSYEYFKLQYGLEENPLLSEVTVPNGSKTKLTLQDGSTIWLNAGSQIQYDSNFGKENRVLKLSGEAYLEVAKNKKCPFIVETGEIKIKVLGTRFNVNAYADNTKIEVALLQGAVEMETETGNSFKLNPNDIAIFNTSSKETIFKKNSNFSKNSIDWIKNRLIFTGENFEQIIHTLERSFNVRINIHNETIRSRCFMGDFVNNETIEQIFNVMSTDGKFKYTIKGNVIDVY